jgi:hypothetical protein
MADYAKRVVRFVDGRIDFDRFNEGASPCCGTVSYLR